MSSKYLFSPSTNGFYHFDLHKDAAPSDCIYISEEVYFELLNGQELGQRIVPDSNGYPVLSDTVISADDQVSLLRQAVKGLLDQKAKEHGFTSLAEAISYIGEEGFDLEARAFKTWRSQVRSYVESEVAAFKAGTKPITELQEFLASIPAFSL